MTAQAAASPGVQIRIGDRTLVTAGLLAITLIFWLPFGFSIPFWADGWPTMSIADRGVVVVDSVRPFVYVPYAFARLLSPNLFLDLNVVLAAAIFGKGLFLYLLVKRLTSHKALAFAAAALVIVLPADTAIFNEGTFSIHVALLAYIAAVYFLVAYWQDKRWSFPMLVLPLLALTVGIYEAVYPLIIFTPLLLVLLEKRISRRLLAVAAFWYVVPVVAVVRLLMLGNRSQANFAYQSNLFRGIDVQAIVSGFAQTYQLQFWGGWQRYTQNIHQSYALAAGLISVAILWRLGVRSGRLSVKTLLLIMLGGLVTIALGFSAYSLTALRESANRTFFYASVGGAVTIAGGFLLAIQWLPFKALFYALVTAALVGIGMWQLLQQHQGYVIESNLEIRLLRDIETNIHLIQPNSLILVIDDSDNQLFGKIFVNTSYYLQSSLAIVTQDPTLAAVICYPHEQSSWGNLKEQCKLESDRVLATTREGTNLFHETTYDRVVAFRYHNDGTLTLETSLAPDVVDAKGYDPYKLIDQSAPLPPRVSILLGETSENSP